MKLPPAKENLRKLREARVQADERRPGDRRDRNRAVAPQVKERRSGGERRGPESVEALRSRVQQYRTAPVTSFWRMLYRYPLMIGLLVVLGLLFS